jgi:Dna[CI] antecedent DciA-like protein
VSAPAGGPELEFCVEQAGTGLEKVVADSLRRMPANEATLTAWPLVCGSVVAERTRALDFAGGVLRVEVADAGWRRELQALAPRYVATINRYTIESVQRIEFVIAFPSK